MIAASLARRWHILSDAKIATLGDVSGAYRRSDGGRPEHIRAEWKILCRYV